MKIKIEIEQTGEEVLFLGLLIDDEDKIIDYVKDKSIYGLRYLLVAFFLTKKVNANFEMNIFKIIDKAIEDLLMEQQKTLTFLVN